MSSKIKTRIKRRKKNEASQEGNHEPSLPCIQNNDIDNSPSSKNKNGNSVRPWLKTKMINSAFKNDSKLNHWCRIDKLNQDSPFAVYNRTLEIPSYTYQDYDDYLQSEDWTLDETDHLFDLARRFDLKFIIMHDRWDRETFQPRSIEDLKDRYYACVSILSKHKSGPGLSEEMKNYVFDKKHEEARKKQLELLWSRTPEQLNEEKSLREEYEKIMQDRREKEVQNKILRPVRRSSRLEKSPPRSSKDFSTLDEFENLENTNSSRKTVRKKRNSKKSFRKPLEEIEDDINNEIETEEERKIGGKVAPKNYNLKDCSQNIEINDVEREIRKESSEVENSPVEEINIIEAEVAPKEKSENGQEDNEILKEANQEKNVLSNEMDVENTILKEEKSLDESEDIEEKLTLKKSKKRGGRRRKGRIEQPKISQNSDQQVEIHYDTEIMDDKNENQEICSVKNPPIEENVQTEEDPMERSINDDKMTEQTTQDLKETFISHDNEPKSDSKSIKKIYSNLREFVAEKCQEMTRHNAKKKMKAFDTFLTSLNDKKPLPYNDVYSQLYMMSGDIFDSMQKKKQLEKLEEEIRKLEREFNEHYPSKPFPWSFVFEAAESSSETESLSSFPSQSESSRRSEIVGNETTERQQNSMPSKKSETPGPCADEIVSEVLKKRDKN